MNKTYRKLNPGESFSPSQNVSFKKGGEVEEGVLISILPVLKSGGLHLALVSTDKGQVLILPEMLRLVETDQKASDMFEPIPPITSIKVDGKEYEVVIEG